MNPLDILSIIECARTAPSGDNCQPWRFKWDGHRLGIFHETARARHAFNEDLAASKVSFGMVLELIEIAASQQGFFTTLEILGEVLNPAWPWARVRFSPSASVMPDPLYAAVRLRKCGRFPYAREPLKPALFADLEADLKGAPGYAIRYITEYSAEFVDYLLRTEDCFWQNAAAVRDTFQWVRLTRREYARRRDGLWRGDLGAHPWEVPSVSLFRRFPKLPDRLYGWGLRKFLDRAVREKIISSPVYFLVTTTQPQVGEFFQDPFLHAGRRALRLWLQAARHGYVMQPHFHAGTGPYRQRLPGFRLSEAETRFFKAGAEVLRRTFSLPAEEYPIWLCRVGRMPRTHVPTLRLPIEEILTQTQP